MTVSCAGGGLAALMISVTYVSVVMVARLLLLSSSIDQPPCELGILWEYCGGVSDCFLAWCSQRILGFLILVRISLPPTFDPDTR